MQTSETPVQTTPPSPIDCYLLVEQPRQRLGHWTQALAALDSELAPPIAMVAAYYDPTSDQALLQLSYEQAAHLTFVVEIALLAEVGMIQPRELSDAERKRLVLERLGRCTIRVTTQRTVIAALSELVKAIKDQRSRSSSPPLPPPLPLPPPPPVGALVAKSVLPRGDTSNPVLLVNPKGTRDNVPRIDPAELAGPKLPSRPPRADDITPNTSRHVIERMRAQTAEMPTVEAEKLLEEARTADLGNTSPPRLVRTASGELGGGSRPRAESPSGTSLEMIEPEIPSPGIIYARYLRSGKWVACRVGALSLKGAALLAGALPRMDDRVDIALSFDAHRALVRGRVTKVSSIREAQTTGASTFSMAFELDDASRRLLTQLLTAARAAKITIKPPPPRATRRFPVEWPICVGTTKGAIKADALDVSTAGMFVRPAVPLELDSTVNFSVVLDDGGSPVGGRAKVIRQISEQDARTAGLAAGYGLGVVEMTEAERMRWLGFLARVERRAEKRVLIGATPQRLAVLQAALASCGYAVNGGTDPGALVQLANAEARPVDAALIDAGWLQNGAAASWVETLFSSRNVPCVTLHGDAKRARMAIDRLLEVVV